MIKNLTNMLKPWYRQLGTHPEYTWYVPICHQQIHWLFIKINTLQQKIEQYDSLTLLNIRDYTFRLKTFLEHCNQQTWQTSQKHTQQQTNGYDCGAHILAERHSQVRYIPPQWHAQLSQKSIPDLLFKTKPSTLFTNGSEETDTKLVLSAPDSTTKLPPLQSTQLEPSPPPPPRKQNPPREKKWQTKT